MFIQTFIVFVLITREVAKDRVSALVGGRGALLYKIAQNNFTGPKFVSNSGTVMTESYVKFKIKIKLWMLKAPPHKSSDLHFSILQNRPDRGPIICSKICS